MENAYFIPDNYIANQTTASIYTEYFSYTYEESLPLHGHTFLEIGITLNGTTHHVAEKKTKVLHPGSVYVIPIGTVHHMEQVQNWEIRNIYLLPTTFSAHLLNMDFYTYYKLQNFLMRHHHQDSEVLQFTLRHDTCCAIKSLSDALSQPLLCDTESFRVYQNHCIVSMLLLLAEDYYAQFGNAEDYRDPRLIEINQFIHTHLDLPLKQLLTELSDTLSLNSQYVNRIFKRSFGIPISSYIIQCKIEKSIQLLQAPDTSPTDIALSLGFYDYAHFHKYFSKYVGMTPHKYQNPNNTLFT